jgi:hypothetical protein
MHIFLSYAAEDRNSAEQIYLALTSAGHQVFFDQATLPAGGDYNARIRQALLASELLIFLISPDPVAPSSYALTELNFAREKWPHPGGVVLPVMVRSTEFASIPNYLKAVTVLEPSGNAAAEVAAWVASQKKTSVKNSIRNIIGKRTLIGTSIFVVVTVTIFFIVTYQDVPKTLSDRSASLESPRTSTRPSSVSLTMQVALLSAAERTEFNTHQITARVVAPDGPSPKIDHVVYLLPPSFGVPQIRRSTAEDGFAMTINGSGSFLLQAKVYLADGTVRDLSERINLRAH